MSDMVVTELSDLISRLRTRRDELDSQIQAAKLTLETYIQEKDLADARPPIDPRELVGLKHIEALKKIASLSGGVVRVAEAKRLLLAAGLSYAKPANLQSHIHNALKESEEFVWESRGAFRLVSRQPTLLQTG